LITKIWPSLVYDLVPVGLDLIFGDILKFFSRKSEKNDVRAKVHGTGWTPGEEKRKKEDIR